jgi:hypothetical protein
MVFKEQDLRKHATRVKEMFFVKCEIPTWSRCEYIVGFGLRAI